MGQFNWYAHLASLSALVLRRWLRVSDRTAWPLKYCTSLGDAPDGGADAAASSVTTKGPYNGRRQTQV